MTYLPNYPPFIQVARGKLSDMTCLHKFGVNRSATAGDDIISLQSAANYPATAQLHNIASTDALDGSGAATGMLTVYIEGCDGSFNAQSETVTLNGTSNVATVNSYLRIWRMYGVTWGTGLTNAGVISATGQTSGTVTCEINTTGSPNQSEAAIYTVPLGWQAIIPRLSVTVSKTSGANSVVDFGLEARDASLSNAGWRVLAEGAADRDAGISEIDLVSPLVLSAGWDIRMNVHSISAGTPVVFGNFDVMLGAV